ncbi:MAG TPA: hypothetical protein VFQ22_07350 [Longimicrobiales bacterium]|nr:hypothetical protein [Longimicrobiales bacterium]
MKPFPRWLVLLSSTVTGASGVVLWWMEHVMEPVDEFAVVSHPLQPLVLKTHIVAAPFLVFAVGLIAADHVWKHWRTGVRRGRRSGLSAMWVFVPMVLTGYLVQAVTSVTWLEVVAWVHVITGVVYLVGFALHQVVARRRPAAGRSRAAGERPAAAEEPLSSRRRRPAPRGAARG